MLCLHLASHHSHHICLWIFFRPDTQIYSSSFPNTLSPANMKCQEPLLPGLPTVQPLSKWQPRQVWFSAERCWHTVSIKNPPKRVGLKTRRELCEKGHTCITQSQPPGAELTLPLPLNCSKWGMPAKHSNGGGGAVGFRAPCASEPLLRYQVFLHSSSVSHSSSPSSIFFCLFVCLVRK